MRLIAIVSAALSALPVLTPLARAQETASQHDGVQATIATFKKKDPGIQKFFDDAVGIAVLPTVGKGAIGIGGAHGTGELLVGENAIGKVSMTQVTIGFQFGGQAYSEIIFFRIRTPSMASRTATLRSRRRRLQWRSRPARPPTPPTETAWPFSLLPRAA